MNALIRVAICCRMLLRESLLGDKGSGVQISPARLKPQVKGTI